MQSWQHVDDCLCNRGRGVETTGMCRLSHERMNHEIGRVGFNHLCGLGLADYMALGLVSGLDDKARMAIELTMSAPSLAVAMAEK
jgi:hypothetical protein